MIQLKSSSIAKTTTSPTIGKGAAKRTRQSTIQGGGGGGGQVFRGAHPHVSQEGPRHDHRRHSTLHENTEQGRGKQAHGAGPQTRPNVEARSLADETRVVFDAVADLDARCIVQLLLALLAHRWTPLSVRSGQIWEKELLVQVFHALQQEYRMICQIFFF
jgi:hypothetical protein